MRAPPAQAPPRFSRTGTRGQEPVAGAFAGDRYPGRVPKGAACVGRPPSTCAHDYVLVFLASASKKNEKRQKIQ